MGRCRGDHGARLMTSAEARSIGSRVPRRDGAAGAEGGDAAFLETVFVAVASYRDWQCAATVEGILARATHPERVRVAVVDQRRDGDTPCDVPPGGTCDTNPDQATCRHRAQVDYFLLDADLAVGPVFARHLGHRLYR